MMMPAASFVFPAVYARAACRRHSLSRAKEMRLMPPWLTAHTLEIIYAGRAPPHAFSIR